MCGIAGFTTASWLVHERRSPAAATRLWAMTGALAHRGPDARRGVLLDGVALGHTRLSIVDIEGGQQPMRDPRTGTCVVLNGEIFNYLELRAELREYCFRTRSDTEVILAAYQRWGIACVERFLGQWAFALWDPDRRELHLSRDRLGVRPLYYAETTNGVVFASETKALFASGLVEPMLDPLAIKETTCLWTTVSPRTSFQGVLALPPACCGLVTDGRVAVRRYWTLDLSDREVDPSLTMDRAVPLVAELLDDAVRLRLRADVPVGSYLSGGLDSSLICALAQRRLRGTGSNLSTFSVAFSHATYDESPFQRQVASDLGTDHHELFVTDRCIGELLPEVVRLAEQPLARSAPAPLLALSGMARDCGTKVVVTGEGADEFFWGYQLYRESKIRQWGSQRRRSNWGGLLQRVYSDLRVGQQAPALLEAFWSAGLHDPGQPGFSHLPRWSSTARIWRFFSQAFSERVLTHDPVQSLLATAPQGFSRWRGLARAQFLETQTLLSGYLLSAQGDRMLMGNSVEGRFPFLDHRLVELAARLPDTVKLRVLDEKHVLKRIAAPFVPAPILHRAKQPYRAPIAEALAGSEASSWTRDALAPDAVDAVGVFDSKRTEGLRRKLSQRDVPPSESDNMALMAIASVQLLHQQFVRAGMPAHGARAAVRVTTTASACDAGAA